MSEKNVLFNGSEGSNLEPFWFHFENVAKPTLEGEEKAIALIKHLRGKGFDFYYEQFAVVSKLSERKVTRKRDKNFTEPFRQQKGPWPSIERASKLRLTSKQSLEDLVEIAPSAYDEAEFIDEEKFVFLSKSALLYEDIQNFAVHPGPSNFEELREVLFQLHLSCARFRNIDDSSVYASKQDSKGDHRYSKPSNDNKTEAS